MTVISTSAWWLSSGAMISPDTPGSGWVLPHNIIYNIMHNHLLQCSSALTKHRLLVFMGGPIKFNQIKIKQQSKTREFMKKHSICADMSCSTMWWENLRGSEELGDILRSQLIASSYKTNNNIDLIKMMQKHIDLIKMHKGRNGRSLKRDCQVGSGSRCGAFCEQV